MKKMKREIISFIKKFSKEIKEQNAAIFAGAGFSMKAGYVNWSKLLEPLAEEIGIDISKESDLVSLAQYYKNEKSNRTEITNRIIEEFSKKAELDENHLILSRLPITAYWTTNYDSLIEDSLKVSGKVADVKYTVDQLVSTKPNRDAVVYKMHGDKEHSSKAIIIKEDYELYNTKYAPFITALSGDLVSKTFLFVGFSFTDPNLDYILSRVRVIYGENQRTHYSFVKNVKREECDSDADFEYLERKQELFIQDLKRYNIEALIIDDYSEITSILKMIEKNINENNIFISGSAHNYSPWNEKDAQKFINDLSKKLIEGNKKIISGFGLGVGSFVITGALEQMYLKQGKINNNQLILRPFPQKTLPNPKIDMLQKKYREDMISLAGVSIFIFGNKINKDNTIIDADGIYSEFKIAKAKENIIVPVGSTGSVARKIWKEVDAKFDEFYPKANDNLKELFKSLNEEKDSEKLINIIIDFIDANKEININ